jgi:hypothetical protein
MVSKENDSPEADPTANDTSAEAASLQASVHRRMSGAERFRIALDMSLTARAFTVARLRQEHSDWSDRRLMLELVRMAFLPAELPPGLHAQWEAACTAEDRALDPPSTADR